MTKIIKAAFIMLLVFFVVAVFSSCTAGPNKMVKSGDSDGEVAGFWTGLWHGFIAFFTFIISLFSDKVNIYEVHNSGGWYNFGFILGVMMFFGSSGGAGKSAHSKRKK